MLKALWPAPPRSTAAQRALYAAEDKESTTKILELRNFSEEDLENFFAAAHRILDYEDRRRTGAEGRATGFIAAVATLIPLMTWALGSSTPTCDTKLTCGVWSVVFNIAVAYFVFAAYWSLKTLAVARFHTIGVEDLVELKESGKAAKRELVKQSLLQARLNRDTINEKLDFIRTAQRCFFIGLFVLAGLLAVDPWLRFPVAPTAQTPSPRGNLPQIEPELKLSKELGGSLPSVASPASWSVPLGSAVPTRQ